MVPMSSWGFGRFIRTLGSANILIGTLSCFYALILTIGLVPWPFEGDKPSESNILLTHFSLGLTGFIVLSWQLQASRNPVTSGSTQKPAGTVLLFIKTVSAAFAGMIQVAIVMWAWENGFQDREWVLWLLVPGVTGTLAWLWVLDAAPQETTESENAEDTQEVSASDIVRAEIVRSRNFDLLQVLRTGLRFGSLIAGFYAGIAIFVVYREALIDVFFFDRFLGWEGLFRWIGRVLGRVGPFFLGLGGLFAFILIGETLLRRLVSIDWKSSQQNCTRELTDDEAMLMDAILDGLETTLGETTSKAQKIAFGIVSFLIAILCATGLVMLSFWPVFVALALGNGLGSQLFEGVRTEGLDPALYIDGFGAFEFALAGASASLLFFVSCWVSRLMPSSSAWFWKFSDNDTRRQQLSKSIAHAVHTGEVKEPSDFSFERAYILLSKRYERGSILLATFFVVCSILVWPLDRLHYAIISDDYLEGGHYYLPGSVERFDVSKITSVKRGCYEGDDNDITRWDLKLPNGAAVGLITQWHSADERERVMLMNVATQTLSVDPKMTGRIDKVQCRSILDDRFGDDAARLAPLFGLDS